MILTFDWIIHSHGQSIESVSFHLDTPRMGPSDFRTYTTTGTIQGRKEKENRLRKMND